MAGSDHIEFLIPHHYLYTARMQLKTLLPVAQKRKGVAGG